MSLKSACNASLPSTSKSHDVSSEEILARGAEMLAEAQHGGQNQDAGVADLDTAIVVVQRMGDGAIRESRVGNRKFDAGAEHRRLGRPAEFGDVTRNGLADRL